MRWVYEFQAGVRVRFSDSSHGWLKTGRYRTNRDQFTKDEVGAARNYLAGNGLIEVEHRVREGVGRWAHRVTTAGAECMENYGGDVAKYLDAQKRGGTSINIRKFEGAAVFGDNATQNVGVPPEAMAGFVNALLKALPSLQLEPNQRARAQAALKEVEREAKRTRSDPDRVRGALNRFVQGMIDAGPRAITDLMLMFARGYIGPGS